MAYLSNKTVNYLNLHVALMGLLEQSYLIFVPIFLYTHGFTLPEVLMLQVMFNMTRIPLRLLSFPIIRRWGLKAAVMIGAAGYGVSFPVMGHIAGYNNWLALYTLLYGITNSLHWFAFHTFYSLAGEHEKRGRQVAVALALMAGLAALAPFLSALLITGKGFASYFLMAIVLVMLMLLCLSRCENIPLPPANWREGRKAAFSIGPRIHVLESSLNYLINTCWLFTVYFFVGDMLSLGGIVSFGVVAQMAYQLLLGSLVDKGRGASIVSIAAGLRAAVAAVKALLPLSVPGILTLEAASAAATVHMNAVEPTALYNAGKEAQHPLWFWLFTETAWDIGTLVGAGGAALLLELGVPLQRIILVAIPFVALLWRALHTYFARHPKIQLS